MERIVHVLSIHSMYKQTYRANHHHGIGSLDGNDYIIKLLTFADAQKFHATLHDALRSIAITRHDAVRQGTMVHADTYGGMILLAYLEERHETRLYLLKFSGIFLIRVLQLLEGTGRVHIVAWIDTHLLGIESSHISHMGIEMHISHQWSHIAVLTQTGIDILQIFRFLHALCSETHIFTTRINDALGLSHTALGIIGGSGGHRLYADRVLASQRRVAYLNLARNTALIIE